MRCNDVQRRLNAYSTGALPAEARRAVQTHLAECADCRAKLAAVDTLAAALVGAQVPPIPLRLATRVMAAARQRRESQPVAAWNLLRWWRMASAPMHVAAAAALIVGLSVGIVMGWTAAPAPTRVETAAQADPVGAYQIDYLGEVPSGSLADSYLTLVSAPDEGGR